MFPLKYNGNKFKTFVMFLNIKYKDMFEYVILFERI